MNQPPFEPGSQPEEGQWEIRVRAAARAFVYPPTPDVAGAVRQRTAAGSARRAPGGRLAWTFVAAMLILAGLGGLLAVPQVRAALVEVLRIGAVRILLAAPTPTATPTAPAPTQTRPTATPKPTATPLTSVLDLAGETSLAEAQARAGFAIKLPSYPPDLGPPDRVFLQDMAGPVVIMAWLAPEQPDRVQLSLHQLGPGTFAEKVQPRVVQETTVRGQPALWTEGPHLLQVPGGGYEPRRLVTGNTLIWAEGEITYRLETDLPLEEALRIAESLE
jgi:hypothetical protein